MRAVPVLTGKPTGLDQGLYPSGLEVESLPSWPTHLFVELVQSIIVALALTEFSSLRLRLVRPFDA